MSDPKQRWCEAKETGVRGYWLPAPYDHVYVGSDPRDGMTIEAAQLFDAIMNVSDSPGATFDPARPDQRTYWWPVAECGYWGYAYVFWLVKILDFHHERHHRVYLHCHAGAYRSPTAAYLWLLSRGHSRDEALLLAKPWNGDLDPEHRNRRAEQPFRLGNVREHVFELFKRMKEHPEWSLEGIYHSPHELELTHELFGRDLERARKFRRFNRWYRAKWAIQKNRDRARWYLQGCSWTTEGASTTVKRRDSGFFAWANRKGPMWLRSFMKWAVGE